MTARYRTRCLPPLPEPPSAAELMDRLQRVELRGMGGGGFATHLKLAAAQRWAQWQGQPPTLIANAVACEPGIDGDLLALEEAPESIVQGLVLLAHALAVPEPMLALGPRTERYAAVLSEAWTRLSADRAPLRSVPISEEPGAGAELRILRRAGLNPPASEQRPAEAGLLVFNVLTLLAVACAVAGDRLLARPVTVAGETRWVPLGTPLAALLKAEPGTLWQGGPGSGAPATANAVVELNTLAVDRRPLRAADPCIHCGQCAPHCPVQLDPEALWLKCQALPQQEPTLPEALSSGSALSQLVAAGLGDCIECGDCNLRCPSEIDLLAAFRQGKARQAAVTALERQAERSAARFARHEARLANRQAARQDRRRARLAQRRDWR